MTRSCLSKQRTPPDHSSTTHDCDATVVQSQTLYTDRTFHDLMGKKTEARYEFLMANAGQADNLDV